MGLFFPFHHFKNMPKIINAKNAWQLCLINMYVYQEDFWIMSRVKLWTQEEIEKMKINFLMGKRIKAMARELGRTPSALNKALSRFGIRKQNKKQHHALVMSKASVFTSLERKETLKKSHVLWVNFVKVIEYLSKSGYMVKLCDSGQPILDHQHTSKSYLVMLANKLRQQENKPAFMVEDVTW
jgi:hypothetical protein